MGAICGFFHTFHYNNTYIFNRTNILAIISHVHINNYLHDYRNHTSTSPYIYQSYINTLSFLKNSPFPPVPVILNPTVYVYDCNSRLNSIHIIKNSSIVILAHHGHIYTFPCGRSHFPFKMYTYLSYTTKSNIYLPVIRLNLAKSWGLGFNSV